MNKGQTRTFLFTGLLLIIFWIIVVSSFSFLTVFLGFLCSFLILWLSKDYILMSDVRFPINLKNLGRLLIYVFDLIFQIVVANFQVAKIVLSPNMNLSPTFIKLKSKVDKEATKTILGNSITLTPGTLTVDIDEETFIVHGLTKENAYGLLDWHMIDYLVQMEEEDSDRHD